MDLPRRRRVSAVLGALLVVSVLAGCTVSTGFDDPQASRAAREPQPAVARADLRAAGARIVDDARSASLVILPRRSNGGLVVFLHGYGQNRWSLLSRRPESTVANALSAAGFTILAADASGHPGDDGKAWGDPTSIADYEGLIGATTATYDLHDVFLMGESMGGLATMQLARRLGTVRAATAWFPVCDLSTMHEARFQPSIRAAWRGLSRAPVSPVQVGDTPLMVWASPEDTVVDASENAARCVAEARAAGADVTYIHTTGQHGDPSNYQPDVVVAFFEKHRTPGA